MRKRHGMHAGGLGHPRPRSMPTASHGRGGPPHDGRCFNRTRPRAGTLPMPASGARGCATTDRPIDRRTQARHRVGVRHTEARNQSRWVVGSGRNQARQERPRFSAVAVRQVCQAKYTPSTHRRDCQAEVLAAELPARRGLPDRWRAHNPIAMRTTPGRRPCRDHHASGRIRLLVRGQQKAANRRARGHGQS